ncbi:hypothetical protein BJ878DRAFT_314958 [Calycina marina]|uniref:Uncharacterized protein n=1 Tax=Calycina marina TaxID=1763456 RepID=A0A9P8CGV2_9HELO|nr:hypothetical protein BJ878DRAFT_314958 [Calycina marina]
MIACCTLISLDLLLQIITSSFRGWHLLGIARFSAEEYGLDRGTITKKLHHICPLRTCDRSGEDQTKCFLSFLRSPAVRNLFEHVLECM